MAALGQIGERSRATLTARLRRVRGSIPHAVQAGVAAGLSWLVAHDLVGHRSPFFAPIAAVVVLAASLGQRLRRAVELVLGVALGILVGDTFVYFIGTGPWQIGVVVTLAILAAVFVGGSATLIGQSGSSAVLVATLAPPSNGIYYGRFIDSLIGGAVGVLAMAVLLPVNPLTVVKKAVGPVLEVIVDGLTACAQALADRDQAAAAGALDRLRTTDPVIAGLHEALVAASEAATLAPVRWRVRAPLAQYLDASTHIDRALRNTRVLARRSTILLAGEEVPDGLAAAVRTLAEAVRTFTRELAQGREPVQTRAAALRAVSIAGEVYRRGLGLSGSVVVAQIRSIAADLMRGSGLPDREGDRAVRRAAGKVSDH